MSLRYLECCREEGHASSPDEPTPSHRHSQLLRRSTVYHLARAFNHCDRWLAFGACCSTINSSLAAHSDICAPSSRHFSQSRDDRDATASWLRIFARKVCAKSGVVAIARDTSSVRANLSVEQNRASLLMSGLRQRIRLTNSQLQHSEAANCQSRRHCNSTFYNRQQLEHAFATDATIRTNFCAAQHLTQLPVRFRQLLFAATMKGHGWAADQHVIV